MVDFLLENGADTNALNNQGETVFHLAVAGSPIGEWSYRDVAPGGSSGETIRRFLEMGADITTRDKKHATVLHKAARLEDELAIRLLLEI